MSKQKIWQAKLAARIHDPAEKALVLLTDPSGHEGGTVRKLRQQLFDDATWKGLHATVKRADHWASAADRPQFPQDEQHRFARWTQVRFADKPELIHPLSGDVARLDDLNDVDFTHIKALSEDHFNTLIYRHADGSIDWQKTALAFWRFGPELNVPELKALWQLLPADTRVPDHTIWSHLDLTSAFAGAMTADGEQQPALLVMSFGPVQSFIAQARSTSDLWAGSHLLSTMIWQGLQTLCEQCGPDAVLFPQLRGIPQTDLWLHAKLGKALPKHLRQATDSNPLFSAALPNRFVAIVPAGEAAAIAQSVVATVRNWVMQEGGSSLQALCEKSGVADPGYATEQMQRHLEHFPEAYWLTVPWSLIDGQGSNINTDELRRSLQLFYPDGEATGFLDSEAWQLLTNTITLDGQRFYQPNGGVLYPALFDLLERANASVKTLRPFRQQHEAGYGCTLCGEREWLHTEQGDPRQRSGLFAPPGKRQAVLWQKLPPSWSRKGKEQLCGLCALKRLWPSRFADWVAKQTQSDQVDRFVISTHTMAITGEISQLSQPLPDALLQHIKAVKADRVALPSKLARELCQHLDDFSRLPDLLDIVRNDEPRRHQVETALKAWLGHKPEAYYAFILMDGDQMGAWLQGNEEFTRLPYRQGWHSQIRSEVDKKSTGNPGLKAYINSDRPVSPARHCAISAALNDFSLHLARYAVEEAYHGKLLYAGGDDVMAMIPVRELLPCMRLLRCLYSGHAAEEEWIPGDLKMGNGFVHYRGRLLRLMGKKATASSGAVVAHHTMPLQRVLKELRAAEHTAKNKGGRDAFSVRVLKRSGGAISVSSKWFKSEQQSCAHPIDVLHELARALGNEGFSRRAAYHSLAWLRELPGRAMMKSMNGDDASFEGMLSANLQRQFKQQGASKEQRQIAQQLSTLACNLAPGKEAEWLGDALSVAEFLGREGRMGGDS